MTKTKTLAAIGAVAVAALALTLMVNRQKAGNTGVSDAKTTADVLASPDQSPSIQTALADLPIQGLSVNYVDGIAILRGSAPNAGTVAGATSIVKGLGHTRVANLIQIDEKIDDPEIRRSAEKELASSRALEGSRLAVESRGGILTVRGTVQNELQKDAVTSLLKQVDGVSQVRNEVRVF